MSRRTLGLDDRLYDYLLAQSLREPPLLAELRAHTAQLSGAQMQISPEQGQFMGLLVELLGARRILEVGTYTGYSALRMALAQGADGEMLCCDVSAEWTAMAQDYWQRAGVRERIDLRLAPALDTLDGLLAEGAQGHYDLMFIDADKSNYAGYYARGLELLRPGGLLLFDNTLWGGAVADPQADDADTRALRALNTQLRDDERISLSLLPVGDGLTLARKRPAPRSVGRPKAVAA